MSKPSTPAAEILSRLEAMVRDRLEEPVQEQAARFVRHYYERVPEEVLAERALPDLYGAALAHWRFARQRAPGETLLRVYNPVLEAHGWESTHTVVEIVIEDMPFLVDTVRMEVNRQGLQALEVIHPIYRLERNVRGEMVRVLDRGEAREALREAVIHLELVRQTDPAMLDALRAGMERVLGDLRQAVEDWQPMQQVLGRLRQELDEAPPPSPPAEELEEARAFLGWLADSHFTFLGYRAYDLQGNGNGAALRIVPGTGLGILRDSPADQASQAFAGLPPQFKRLARIPRLLLLTKANARATVHRPANLDYVGVRRFDAAGRVIGEHRFLGLYALPRLQLRASGDPGGTPQDRAGHRAGGPGAGRSLRARPCSTSWKPTPETSCSRSSRRTCTPSAWASWSSASASAHACSCGRTSMAVSWCAWSTPRGSVTTPGCGSGCRPSCGRRSTPPRSSSR